MKQVSGCILVKETGSGIPNLVVTAYDSERSVQEIVDGRTSTGALSLGHLGKRIGSVLTDPYGGFILNSEDLEFPGNEPRPDLLIIIFAPEDVQELNKPYPLPPEERILYISEAPRVDAGGEEAFVIRLLQEQLDHFHLTAGTASSGGGTDDEGLAAAMEETWNFADRLRDRLKTRLREEQTKSDELQSEAKERVQNLSAIPSYLRNPGLTDSTLLINGRKGLAKNLQLKQDQVVANGLERLKTRTTVIHLRLTESELTDLGLHIEKNEVVGNIDPIRLTERVRAKINGLDLVRKRGLNNPSPEDLIKKYLPGNDLDRVNGEQAHNG